jgi:hypothetical protein
MHNSSRNFLIKLLENGSVATSGISLIVKNDIEKFLDAGLIRWEKKGAGARYVVNHKESIRTLLQSSGYHGDQRHLTPRAQAVARHGDAHKGLDNNLLLILSAAGFAEWSDGENTLAPANHVEQFGISSLLVKPGDHWHTKQPVGLVENLDLVIYASQYFKKTDFQGSLIYYSGWLSRKFLNWLTETTRAPSYVIFPDYDIVGIKNYLIAKARLGDALTMYIPSDIEDLLVRFGTDLDSTSDRTVIESSKDTDALRLYKTLLKTGRSLHQESILLMNHHKPYTDKKTAILRT